MTVLNEDDVSIAYKFEGTIVNLLEYGAARELIDPAPAGTREAPSRFQLTIWVDDTDAVCAELASRDVELLNGPALRLPPGPREAFAFIAFGRAVPTNRRLSRVSPELERAHYG